MTFWGKSRCLTPLSLSENGEQLSESDSSESVNSARDNVNPVVGFVITNDTITDSGEKSNSLKRRRKSKIDSPTIEAVEKYVGKPIDEAAMSPAVSRSTLKRLCRGNDMPIWPLPKHNKRTVNVTDSKLSRISKSSQNLQLYLDSPLGLSGAVLLLVRIKRWSCSSKHHGLSGKWWSCGKHNYPSYKSASIYQVVRLMVSLKRWRKRNATSTVKILIIKATYNKNMVKFPFRLSDGLVTLKEMVATRFQLKPGSLKLKYEDKDSDWILIACDTDLMGSVGDSKHNYPVYKSASIYQVVRLMVSLKWWTERNETTSTVKILTIKATYNTNMVKFPFRLSDGLVTVKEMVATRFQLNPGSVKLKYEDKEGDWILIACDDDLTGSVGDSKSPVNSTVIRLLVLSVAP